MSGELELLAYETALRTLDKQDHLLQELRARAGILLASSSLAVSFMGQTSFSRFDAPELTLAAVTAFVIATAASIYTLIPKRDLSLAPSARATYESLHWLRESIPEVHRQLVYELDAYRQKNARAVRNLTRSCQLASITLVVEIVLLAGLTADNII